MLAIIFALMLGLPPQVPEPPQAPPVRLENPPIIRQAAPKPLPTKTVATHTHRCPHDGTEWTHTHASFGVAADHRCPTCGRLVWDHIVSHGTMAVPAMPAAASSGGWVTPRAVTYEGATLRRK